MNEFTLIGRLTKKPELKTLDSGMVCTNITIATNRRSKTDKDAADFITCSLFGSVAKNCCTYLDKGSQIAASGTIQNNNYEKDGIKYFSYKFICRNVEFISKSRGNKDGQPSEEMYNEALKYFNEDK